MKVVLAKIHILIQNHSGEISRLWNEIGELQNTVSYRIFEKTTQEDLNSITDNLDGERSAFFEKCREIRSHSMYIAYLKDRLQLGNYKHGVSVLLREVKNIGKEKEWVGRALMIMASDRAFTRIDMLHPVDFYKSSFTENSKTYDLMISMFNSKSPDEFRARLNELDKKLVDTNDRIAAINHSKSVDILDYDEFVAETSREDDFHDWLRRQ